jgi:nucleoside phosphorylase
MQRDTDLIRKILLDFETSYSAKSYLDRLQEEGYTLEQIYYHAYLIIQDGLAEGERFDILGCPYPTAMIFKLTRQGHEFIDSVKVSSKNFMTNEADVLIVTVTKVESRALLQSFEQTTGHKATPKAIGDRTYFNLGIVNGARVFLTQSEMGSGGLDASQLTVQKGIEVLSPTAVIMVGIAFGINDQKQAIGDILVTEQLRLYDLQRLGTLEDGQCKISLRGDKPHASPWLINFFKSADADLRWEGAEVRFGVVLTGEKLVDNIDFRDQLRSFEPEAIGGEMEGKGLYVACHDKKVDWILIKAICDWADGNKAQDKDLRQQTAAQNAAEFLLYALEFTSVDWQQKRGKGISRQSQMSEFTKVITNEVVTPTLAMARQSLAYLEEQAAGFGKLHMPAHLRIELEDKRREVAALEARLRDGANNV